MGAYVAGEVVKLMLKNELPIKDNKVLMLGITFKENCPDIRNTRAIDIYHELKTYGLNIDIYDPWAKHDEVKEEYGIDILQTSINDLSSNYGAIILAVAHDEFKKIDIKHYKKNGNIIFDVKGVLPKELVDARL